MHQENRSFPAAYDDFQNRYGTKVVTTSDPPLQSQTAYARGCYMKVSAMLQWVDVMDTYLAWRQREAKHGDYPPFVIEVTNATGIPLETDERQYECKATWRVVNAAASPCNLSTIPGPSWLKLHAAATIELLEGENVQVRFEGDTLTYKSNFSELKVPGRYEDTTGSALSDDASDDDKKKALYVRIIKSFDMGNAPKQKYLVNMFKDSVYEGTRMSIAFRGACKPGSAIATFKEELKKLANVTLCDVSWQSGCQWMGIRGCRSLYVQT